MIDINESYITNDLDMLSEIFNPVEEQTIKLEEGENRVVSILFLDVKGFTAMSEKMDSESVKRTMDMILTTFTNSILKFGGYIDKYEGDLIMALFGSKITSETDTERAINAGLKILSDLKHINNITKFDLSIRIGINTGEVTTGKIGMKREGDFTVYGDTVNLASRMESNAPLDSIMITQDTKEIVENYFIFEDLGDIQVKGKEKPVSVFKVLKKNPKKVERWERNSKIIKRSTYVGRDKELNEILSLFNISEKEIGTVDEEYKPVIIGLKGNAGIGKSRLVKEFVERIVDKSEILRLAQDDSIINNNKITNTSPLLSGYTKSYAQPAYTIWVTMLKKYFSIDDDNSKKIIKEKLDNSYKELILYFKENIYNKEKILLEAKNVIGYLLGIKYEDIRLEKVEPKALQTLIMISMRNTIEAIAYKVNTDLKTPLVIYFDDCQWMDKPSIALLKTFLAALNVEEKRENISNKNIIFLLTYRPEFQPLREFDFDSRFNEFTLKPLTVDFSNDLIDSMLGDHTFTDLFIKKIVENSGGNPFYIEELVNYLVEHSKIIRNENDTTWELSDKADDIHIPLSLNNIILSRIDNLKDELKVILQRASVIGNHFFKSILSEVSKKIDSSSTENLDNSFSILLNDNWISQAEENDISDNFAISDKYLFKHILTSDVCYGSILKYNKKILHKVIAETTEELFKDRKDYYSFIANHYKKAEISSKTVEYLEKAGNYAKENYENEKALIFYNELINGEFYLSDELRIDLFIKVGRILQHIGKWDDAEVKFKFSFELSEKIGDKKRIANSLNSLGKQFQFKGDLSKAMKCYAKDLEINKSLDNKKGISRALGNIGLVFKEHSNYSKAMEYYKKKLIISEELNDKSSISNALQYIGVLYKIQGNYTEALKCNEKSLKICEILGDKMGISSIIMNIGNIYLNQSNYSKAIECYNKDLYNCNELGHNKGISVVYGNMGAAFFLQGNYDKAMEYFEKNLLLSKVFGDKRGISKAIGNIGFVFLNQGNFCKALSSFEKKIIICKELGDKRGVSIAIGDSGIVHEYQENLPKAIDCYKEALNIDFKLNLNADLPSHLYNLANCLFKIKKYNNAKETNEKCYIAAKKVGNKGFMFSSEILKEKLEFKLTDNFQEKQQKKDNLMNLLKNKIQEDSIAKINYELSIMNYELKQDSSEYKKIAIDIYKKLYEKTPNIEYKNNFEELEGL